MFKYHIEFYNRMVKSFKDDEWQYYNQHRIKHKKEDLYLWISNGFIFFTGFDCNIRIPLIMRLPLWMHYKRMLLKQSISTLK